MMANVIIVSLIATILMKIWIIIKFATKRIVTNDDDKKYNCTYIIENEEKNQEKKEENNQEKNGVPKKPVPPPSISVETEQQINGKLAAIPARIARASNAGDLDLLKSVTQQLSLFIFIILYFVFCMMYMSAVYYVLYSIS